MRQNKLKIAVTGGIGSGKSTVCKIIKKMGYPVFSCDEIYAQLFSSGYFTEDIVKEFGNGVLDGDGHLSRRKLGEIVFSDDKKLQALNNITHPKIFEKMFAVADGQEGEEYFFEVPVLFEGGYEKLFDKIIVVTREEEGRIKSVMARDNLSREKVISRLKMQHNYLNNELEEYYVIHNSGNFDDLEYEIRGLLVKVTSNN